MRIKTNKKYGVAAIVLGAGLITGAVALHRPAAHAVAVQPASYFQAAAKPDAKPAASVSPQPASTPAVSATKKAAGVTPAAVQTPAVSLPRGAVLFASGTVTGAVTAAVSTAASSSDAAILSRLAAQPAAAWFGGWSGDIGSAVRGYVSAAGAANQLPVLVAYNLPNRDCGGQSAGGAGSAQAYADWIQAFANGIGGRSALVIVEPDAVAADCFDASRASMLRSAVQTLSASGASVYLDAGNPSWRSAADMASRLNQAGIAGATGFSLNVSNFQTTAANIAYGTQLSKLTGGKHFVVDTSRNGNGPSAGNEWCNPAGRAIGALPTLQTASPLADAYLWVKVPGESDGACGSAEAGTAAPPAGTFWPAYALMLARGAGW